MESFIALLGYEGSENNRARGKLSFSPLFLCTRTVFRENRGQINALLRIEEHHSRCKGFVSVFVTRGFHPEHIM